MVLMSFKRLYLLFFYDLPGTAILIGLAVTLSVVVAAILSSSKAEEGR
jgi:hypothetical protein